MNAQHAFLLAPTILATTFIFPQSGFTPVTDATNPINIFTSAGIYKGAAWIDYDNDGDIDLFAAPRFLFRNDGSDVFTQITTTIGAAPLQNVGGSSWGDRDNDGDLDMLLGQYPSGVFRNDGAGTFTDLTAQYDSLVNYASWAAAFGNIGDDQLLDQVFSHAAGFHPIAAGVCPSRLYSSSGTALQGLLTGIEITDETGPYTVPYWSDYDQDGDMDLFMASGPGGSPGLDFCYRNQFVETGSVDFERMTTEQFAVDLQDGQCYNFIDVDNDTDLDLLLTNFTGAPSRLYFNNAGTYVEVTGFSTTGGFLANDWGDFDNDGDLDVILTQQGVGTLLYRNDAGTLNEVPGALPTGTGACGVVNGDYDNDGDLDVFVHGTNVAKQLFRNDSVAPADNYWINIALTGTTSNRSAIGAFVSAKATINGIPVWQLREVNAQNSFQGQNDLRVHFGLGDAASIDSLTVRWPSGTVQHFTGVAPDQFNSLLEGSVLQTSVTENPQPPFSLSLFPNPAENELMVEWADDGRTHPWHILDAAGKIVAHGSGNRGPLVVPIAGLTSGNYRFVMGAIGGPTSAGFIVP